jgi:hypothetical protein
MSHLPYYERWWEPENGHYPLEIVPRHRVSDKLAELSDDSALVYFDEELDCWVSDSPRSCVLVPKGLTIEQTLSAFDRAF